ncbi:spindle pole body component 110-like [Limulus polyphemus]|uniref:Spindle pole body component 110-like n=1 Tax=Limulus polyphemus TaxID=6850 RepID=A0ABM1B0A7_LIMPO|nr:spindle pole body component 110-like [Limulus polyphemus]
MATDINSDIQKLTGLWNAHGKNDHIKPIADMDKQEVLNLLCIILELYESSWSWNVENNVENRKRIQSCLRRLNLDYLIKGSTELEGSNSKVTRLVGALWEKLQQKYGSGGLKQRCLQVQMKRQKQYQQKQEKSVAKRNEEQVCETYVVFSKQSLEKSSLLELQKEEQFSSADSQDLFIDRKIPSGKELPRTPVLPLSIEDSSENLAKIKKADEEPQDNVLEVLSTPVAVGQILLSGKQDQVTLEGSFVLTAESQRVDAEIRTHKVEHTKNSVNKISPNETQIDTPIHFDKSDLTRLNQKDLMIGSSTVYTKDRKIPKGKEIPRTPIKGVSVQTISEKKLYNSLVVEPQSTPKSRHELKTYTHVSQEIHQLSQQDLRLQSLQLLCQNNEDFSSQISECDSTETKQLQPNDRAGEQTFRCQSKSPVLKSFLRKSNVSCINGEISHTGNIKVVEEPSVESCRLPSRVNQLKRRENNSIYASENTEIQNQLPKIKEESGSRSKLIPSTKQQEQLEARKKESVEPDDSSVQKTLVEEDKTSTVKSKAHHDNFVDQHSNSIVDFEAYNSSDAEEDSQLSTCPSNTVNLNQTFTIEDDTSFLKNKNIRRISEDVPTSTISSGIGENNIRKIETDDSEKFGLTNGCHSKKHKVVSTFSLKGQNLGKETENKSYVSDRKQIQCESPTGSNLGVMYKESSVDVNCMGRKDKTKEELETFSLLKESTRHISSLVGKPNNRGKKKYEPSFVNQSLLQTADISEKSKSEQKQVTMSQGNNVNTIKEGKLSKPKFNIIPEHEKTNELNIIKKIESSEVGLSRNESELASKKTCVKKTKNICTQLSTPEQGMKMIATRSKTASRIIKNTCSKVVISPDHDKTQTLKRTQQNTDSKLDVEYDQEKLETTEKKQSTNEELFNANNKNKVKQERKSRKTKQNAALELNILKEEKSIEQRIGNKEIIGTLQDTSNKVDFVNNQEKAANGNQMLVESVRKTTQNSKVELTSTNPKETSEISIKNATRY